MTLPAPTQFSLELELELDHWRWPPVLTVQLEGQEEQYNFSATTRRNVRYVSNRVL
jgi:hypothetical protein